MNQDRPWTSLLAVAGAAGAAVGVIYVIGGAVLTMRYDSIGLSGQQAAAITPREGLFVAGIRSLALWAVIGAALMLFVSRLPDRTIAALAAQIERRRGLLAIAVAVIALVMLLHVWWPLAALGAILAIVVTTARWRKRKVARLLAGVGAIVVVAFAYESNRINYIADWACVERTERAPRVCGFLVGQNSRGHYIATRGSVRPVPTATAPFRLTFIPAARVVDVYSEKLPLSAIEARRRDRREPLYSRLLDIEVR